MRLSWRTRLPTLALGAALAATAMAQTQPASSAASGPALQGAPVAAPTAQTAPALAQRRPAASPAIVQPRAAQEPAASEKHESKQGGLDFTSMLFVFMLATFLGIGVIRRVSRLLHTPLMSLTNAISAIAVVGSLMLAGGKEYSTGYKIAGAVAMFASMTNIISGFLITDRMLKMFKTRPGGKA